MANPAPFTQPEEITSLAPQLDFIRIGARADDVGIAVSNVAHALQCGLEVWFQLMRSSRCMPEQLLEQAKYVEGMGAAVVYLVDTAGAFLPEQVAEIIGAFKAALKIRVGFHGHNNLGLAVANSLAAGAAGADLVDGSLRGLGRDAGNAQMEALVIALQKKGHLQSVDLSRLLVTAETVIDPLMPPSRGIATRDLLTAEANVVLFPMALYEQVARTLQIDFRTLAQYLGQHIASDVSPTDLIDAIEHFGGDAEAIFARLQIR